MKSSITYEWLNLLERKFERQVGAKSNLLAQWLLTATFGVDQKGEQYYRRAKSTFQNLDSMRILDAGCGDGSIALRFAIAGADVVGLDIDCEFIDIARLRSMEMYPQTPIRFICADLCDKNSFSDTGFDLIISIDVIEHVSDAVKYLITLKEMLNPAGKIWLFTPNRLAWANIMRDPHYRLGGLTLMPNRWAAWYAVHLRRKTSKYEIEQLYTQYLLKKLADRCDLRIIYQSLGDFDYFIQKRPWLKAFVRFPVIWTFLYTIYRQRVSTIEAVLS
jgi:SAM-dependent methyltransferase